MRPRGKKKKSVFGNKLASKEAALATWWGQQPGSRIKRGGVAPRGRQQVQSACRENATVRETRNQAYGSGACVPSLPQQRDGRPSGCQKQEDGRAHADGHMQTGTVSPGVCVWEGVRARGEAETRLQPWPLQCSYQGVQGHSPDNPRPPNAGGSCVPPDPLTPWAPELT